MKLVKTCLLALGLAFAPAVAHAQEAPKQDANTTVAVPAQTKESAAQPDVAHTAAAVNIPSVAPIAGIGMPTNQRIHLQEQVTPNGRKALWMHDYILVPMMLIISALVLVLLLWVILRFRRSANPTPSRTSHNTLIEVIWTLVPVLILVAIAVLAVDNRLVIPFGREIRLITTSNDVIHSFAVPAFWAKIDAVPGRINEISFKVEKEGVYFGQCSELCGARHGFMPISVEVVSPEKFAAWVKSKGGTIPGQAKPIAAAAPAATATPVASTTGTDTPTPGTATPPATNQAAPTSGTK